MVADLLIRITQGGHVTRLDYDGQSRRVRESLDGTEIKCWVWAGLSVAEERDASNTVTRRFYAQGEQVGGQAYFYTRDHLGSVRELVDGTQSVRARYDYDPYGVRRGLNHRSAVVKLPLLPSPVPAGMSAMLESSKALGDTSSRRRLPG